MKNFKLKHIETALADYKKFRSTLRKRKVSREIEDKFVDGLCNYFLKVRIPLTTNFAVSGLPMQ
jgi:hypothetical protein